MSPCGILCHLIRRIQHRTMRTHTLGRAQLSAALPSPVAACVEAERRTATSVIRHDKADFGDVGRPLVIGLYVVVMGSQQRVIARAVGRGWELSILPSRSPNLCTSPSSLSCFGAPRQQLRSTSESDYFNYAVSPELPLLSKTVGHRHSIWQCR